MISDKSLELIAKSFKNFKLLVLSSCEGFSTDGLASIAANFMLFVVKLTPESAFLICFTEGQDDNVENSCSNYWTSSLVLLNFYPYFINYITVCPDAVEPLFKQMVNKFIDDRAQPEAIAVGLNTTREICLQMLLDKEKKGSCKILARRSKQIRGHAYQLNPNAPKERVDKRKYYEQKFGQECSFFS